MTTETVATAPADPDFKLIHVGLIQESKSNPRKTFPAKALVMVILDS